MSNHLESYLNNLSASGYPLNQLLANHVAGHPDLMAVQDILDAHELPCSLGHYATHPMMVCVDSSLCPEKPKPRNHRLIL